MKKELTISVKEFCTRTSICRTKAYELIADDEIKSIRVGRRRLIILSSVEDLLGIASKAEENGNGRS